ncbi:hypothetical protein KFE25_013215 [Diacronema lutheri]|uniref:Uncharacterized protein n=1 Tax=Diacronema lutheri TaxID=2081491 RepID=A0A8J5X4P5_DIALT|nr:hypothetical protein KFE25_013215 [Diacronema lutheri]
MTVLPTTAGWFSPAAEVMVNGTAHRLLLRAEHTINVRSVHNLLRETYHSVAILDADPSTPRRVSSRFCLLGARARAGAAVIPGGRASRAGAAVIPGGASPARKAPRGAASDLTADAFRVLPPNDSPQVSATRHAAATRRHFPRAGAQRRVLPSARSSDLRHSRAMEAEQLRSSVTVVPRPSAVTVVELLHADRLRSTDGATSDELTAELLAQSVAAARVRQTVVMLRVLALAVPVCAATLVLALATSTSVAASVAEGEGGHQLDSTPMRASVIAFDYARIVLISIGYGVTGNLITLCFQPVPEHRTRMIGAMLFGDFVIVGAAVPFALAVARLAPGLWAGWLAGDALNADALVDALASLLQVASNAIVLVCRCVWLWRYRTDAQRLLPAKWRSLALLYSGIALASTVTFIGSASSGSLRDTFSAEGVELGLLAAFFVFLR